MTKTVTIHKLLIDAIEYEEGELSDYEMVLTNNLCVEIADPELKQIDSLSSHLVNRDNEHLILIEILDFLDTNTYKHVVIKFVDRDIEKIKKSRDFLSDTPELYVVSIAEVVLTNDQRDNVGFPDGEIQIAKDNITFQASYVDESNRTRQILSDEFSFEFDESNKVSLLSEDYSIIFNDISMTETIESLGDESFIDLKTSECSTATALYEQQLLSSLTSQEDYPSFNL